LRIGPFGRQRQGGKLKPMVGEKAGFAGFPGNGGVEPEEDVGLGAFAFELRLAQDADGAVGGHPVDGAVAGGLEAFLQGNARAPFGGKAVIGVDGECRLVLSERGAGKSGNKDRKRQRGGFDHHWSPVVWCAAMGEGMCQW
jgi:hypothetical protein